ncbi:MAG: HlyD family efflux transporter periplasmic adaptor subunit [Anaerolineae bacterium]|nr:HlyD family efflux transporter periplasmic adaptor subunit [Gemmatimonadaceae bacterium]
MATTSQPANASTEVPFLSGAPPHWAARSLAYFLIFLFAAAVISASIVNVPETVDGPFTLIPVRGTDPIRAPHGGVLENVAKAEGDEVSTGQTLYVIRSDPLGDRAGELGAIRTQVKGITEAVSNATTQHSSQLRADAEELRQLRARLGSLERTVELKEKQLRLTRSLAEKYDTGYTRGAISAAEYTAPQVEAERLAEELERYRNQQEETRASIDGLQHSAAAREAGYRERQRELSASREQLTIRSNALEGTLVLATAGQLLVRSPCTGAMLRAHVTSVGAVVKDGDLLGEVACAQETLQAELTVSQLGVGRIKEGQGVKLLYDAFPHQRYGVRHGRVRWISPSSVSATDSSAFRALIDIEERGVRIDGAMRQFLPGMGGRARVVVGRRSLISYAFEPLRQLRESFAEVPEG